MLNFARYVGAVLCAFLCLLVIALVFAAPAWAADGIPQGCLKYRRDAVRIHHAVWGVNAPVATLVSQMTQESGCNPNARSAYASGLTLSLIHI